MEPSGREDIVFSTILRRRNLAARSRPGIIAGATGGVSRVWILRFFRNTQKLSRWSMIRKKCLKFSRIDEFISCGFSRSTVPSSLHLDCAFPRSRSRSLLGNGLSMDIHKVWVGRWVLKTTVEKNNQTKVLDLFGVFLSMTSANLSEM